MSSAALAERPLFGAPLRDRELGAAGQSVGRTHRSGDGGLTLDEVLSSVWEGLHAAGAAECPVCRARMARTLAGAHCDGCGSELR